MMIIESHDKTVAGRIEYIYREQPDSEAIVIAAKEPNGRIDLLFQLQHGHTAWVPVNQVTKAVDLYKDLVIRGQIPQSTT